MFKSKLQEFCHQRLWNLPEYTTDKQGIDHNPRFQATVTVNNLSFTSPNLCNSSKEAQNDAAKVAFEHFSSPPPPQPSLGSAPVSSSGGSSRGSTVQLDAPQTGQTTQVNATTSAVNDVYGLKDMQYLYKNQLQYYAQRSNIALPAYDCDREGPPHATRFKCKVTIDGQTYESPGFFPTLKEAEHGAARVALMSLSPTGVQQGDSGLYKNLLQELAQKEAYSLPVYNTAKYGETHVPTFVSTVKIAGWVFTGQDAKTKKQAELSAAKVAYISLKECNLSHSPTFVSPANQGQANYSSSSVQSTFVADQHHRVQPTGCMVFSPSLIPTEPAEETRVNSELSCDDMLAQFPQPEIINWEGDSSSPKISAASMLNNDPISSSVPSDKTVTSIVDFGIGQPDGMDAFASNRIRVHPHVPNMRFPEESSVLHSDSDWVAFRLGSQSNQ